MDETNPAYENFRNKMQAFGQPIKGTTRKVSASKFLGRDDLEERIKINEKKITLLKDIIKTQQMTTGMMIASLTQQSPVVGLEKEISDLKDLVGSIKETLVEQTKFEIQRFSEQQRLLETERRKKRESMLEGIGKRTLSFVRSATDGIIKPVQNIFMGIIRFITTIFFGRFLIKLLQFFTNPANIGIVTSIADFIGNNFPVILTSLIAAGVALAFLATKLLGLKTTIALLTGGSFFGTALSGVGLRGITKRGVGTTEVSKTMGRGIDKIDFTRKPSSFQNRVMKGKSFFNKGGLVRGIGNTDTVPAMLTPGEVVINKPAVQNFGLKNLLTINEAGKYPNKKIVPGREKFTARPILKRGITYAQDGGEIPEQFGGFTDILNSLKSVAEGDTAAALSDPEIPKALSGLGKRLKISDLGKEQIPKDITSTVIGGLLNKLDTSKINQTLDNFKSQNIPEKMTQFKSVIKNNIPSPPIETEGEDGGGFDNLSDLFKGMGAFTSESNDFQEDVLAAPLVDADPLKEAVVIR